MLSQSSKLIEKKRIMSLPELPAPRTVRLKFRKVGKLQYISHLDLQRTFMRVITRSCIPAWYTKGFNPHAKLVFSTPLGVGAESECELLDIRIDRDMPLPEIMDRLNAELTDELRITDAYFPKTDFLDIGYADYKIVVHTSNANTETVDMIREILSSSPLMMTKKSKSGEKEIDIIPMISSFEAELCEGDIVIKATLKASSTEYLNPELLISALRERCGILSGNIAEEWYTVMRTAIRKADLSIFE
ncbi:MAG: DUF2344 domain-containing protein [Ruminococcaceae bacterium]|nr:DUF2344 domain-containing protein [Oscillospiraceae bacterium]